MKINLHYALITFFLAVLTPAGVLSVNGQDASYPIPEAYDAEADKERDKVMYSSGEADALLNNKIHVSAPKDSVQSRSSRVVKTQPEAPKNSSKPSSQEDDSILSFNFLYYLFEKYKMQDIVD